MPAALAEARKNLENPPRIYTEIAIEQLDGNRDFFKTAVAAAFPDVKDKALLAEFKQANDAVIAALGDYKKWLQNDLLKRSNGEFAIGEDTYRKKLAADEMIDAAARRAPGDRREGSAEEPGGVRRDRAAASIPKRTPMQVLATVQARPSAGGEAAATTQGELDALGRFMTDHHIDHDAEGGAGARPGDAAVPARDDDRVDGHPRAVRDRRDRGVLQHDAARSEVVGRRTRASS